VSARAPEAFQSLGGRKILGVMPTRSCPAACKHCGSYSSPRATGRLDDGEIHSAIAQAAALDFALVAFTGGEATLEMGNLVAGISQAHALGMRTRLVTNAHWAGTPAEARRMITTFRDCGLDEINYSTGDQHVRFIPLDNVARAIVAALDAQYTVQVMVEYFQNRTITKANLVNHRDLRDRPDRERIEITESPWMPLSPGRTGRYGPGDAVDARNVHARGGCSSILQTYTVEPEGNIAACCGLGMGSIPELYVGCTEDANSLRAAVENAESDFLKLWIRYKGPEKILAWAAARNRAIQWEGMYAHNCQACHRVYRDPEVAHTIREHYEEIVADVMESLVFDEVAYPQAVAALATGHQSANASEWERTD
jgi:hypothetical protein